MRGSTVSVQLLDRVNRFLTRRLSPPRHGHSIRTAQFAQSLALRFGGDQEKAYLAGLAHDLARDEPSEGIRHILETSRGFPFSAWTPSDVSAARHHGPAAAVLLQSCFGVGDEAVLEAVAVHTIGKADMGVLAKILFVADYGEPGRTHVDEGFRRRLSEPSLDRLVVHVIEQTCAYLEERGSAPAESTIQLYRELNNEALVGEADAVHR
jgi:predicted HD superfamily hydrolase involved in NAD metabolism